MNQTSIKSIAVVVAAIILSAASFLTISAFFTSSDTVVNEFEIGYNEVEIHEKYSPPPILEPGSIITKQVYFENTGPNPCVLRARVDLSNEDIKDYLSFDYGTAHGWTFRDGWWYYTEVLEERETTSPLFNTVTIDSSDEVIPLLKGFEIGIYCESRSCSKNANYEDVWRSH